MANNYGLLSVNYGLLWGIVAYYFGLLGVPGTVWDRRAHYFGTDSMSPYSRCLHVAARFERPCSRLYSGSTDRVGVVLALEDRFFGSRYLESQWSVIWGYFQSGMFYFGV